MNFQICTFELPALTNKPRLWKQMRHVAVNVICWLQLQCILCTDMMRSISWSCVSMYDKLNNCHHLMTMMMTIDLSVSVMHDTGIDNHSLDWCYCCWCCVSREGQSGRRRLTWAWDGCDVSFDRLTAGLAVCRGRCFTDTQTHTHQCYILNLLTVHTPAVHCH